jgi:hypothetical protein
MPKKLRYGLLLSLEVEAIFHQGFHYGFHYGFQHGHVLEAVAKNIAIE